VSIQAITYVIYLVFSAAPPVSPSSGLWEGLYAYLLTPSTQLAVYSTVPHLEEEDRLASMDPDVYFALLALVKEEFTVTDAYLWQNQPTFVVTPTPDLEAKIDGLRQKFRAKDMQLLLRKEGDGLIFHAVPVQKAAPSPTKFLSLNRPFLLFLLTVASVTITGYFNAKSFVDILVILGRPLAVEEGLYLLGMTVAYTVAVMAVLGLHEVGHLLACRRHGLKASWPLFIPGIPIFTLGTFGALIRQKDQPLDRNQLFDIGLSGPLVGFLVALVVSVLGYSLSVPISETEYLFLTQYLGEGSYVVIPFLFQRLSLYIFPSPNSFTHILHPLALAGWVATLITFLNIFPIGQLDGGHISRALFGAKWHRRLSYAMIPLMMLTGWWVMALLVLLFVGNNHPGTLDDATGVSTNRKVLSILVVVIFLSCFTLAPDSPLLVLLFS
jgi:Zn-dependent protease